MVGREDRHEQLGTRLVILERKMQPARFESLDAEEMFRAHQRLNALLLSLDDVVDGASDTAAVFKPEEYVS